MIIIIINLKNVGQILTHFFKITVLVIIYYYRMTAIEVRGKSTAGLRKVFVVIPDFLIPHLDKLAILTKVYLFQL